MRTLTNSEMLYVSGGQTASGVEGCPPVRDYDVIDCPQSSMGNFANDIANGIGKLAESIISLFD